MPLRLSHHKLLELPKISRELMSWKNALSAKKDKVLFSLGEPDVSYALKIYSHRFNLTNYPLGLLVEINGVPASLWLTSWPLADRLKEYLSGKELNDIPIDLRAELLEITFKPLLSVLMLHTNSRVRILNFLSLKPTDINEYSLGISFKSSANKSEVRMILLMHDKLLPVMKRLLAYWPDSHNNFWYQQKTTLWLEVGMLELTMGELNQLDTSDILLMESSLESGQLHLRMRSGDYFHVIAEQSNSKQITIESGIQRMSDENYNENNDETIASIDDVPVRLTFDLGEMTMPFNEIKSLTPGYLVDLNIPITQAVTIRSLNRVIGTGELVNIDGRMGVRIIKLLAQNATDTQNG